jgi:N-acetylmuramoyl-L-alanine amidase
MSFSDTLYSAFRSVGAGVACCLFLAGCASLSPPSSHPSKPLPASLPASLSGWVPLADVARRLQAPAAGLRMSAEGATLKTPRHTIRLVAGSRSMVIDGATVWLNAPPAFQPAGSKNLYLSAPDVRDLESLHTPPNKRLPQTARRRYLTVMLDPGHGGEDRGAVSSTTRQQEKDLTLDLARRVAAGLARAPVHVMFTRNDDSALPLDLRVTLTANAPADCLVSIHANAAPNLQAAGVETYLVPAAGFPSTSGGTSEATVPGNRFADANFALAFAVHRQLVKLGRPDRGIKRARYHVLRNAPCPAILVEVGFLSNTSEARRLETSDYRQRLAEAIIAGIRAYVD